MASESSKFQVGAFVIVAAVIGVATIIWLGASRFFEETETYVTYFSESVQGLDNGSPVKFRGVPAGRVGRIDIAPDGNLIEVQLELDPDAAQRIKTDDRFRAKLELTGITGLRYVEIERREGDELRQTPLLTFDPPYPVIPSAQSRFQAIQVALADVYDRLMQVDIGGVAEDARHALQSADSAFDQARGLLVDPRVSHVLDNLEHASAATVRVTDNLEKLTGEVDLKPMIANANQAMADARTLFARLSDVGTEEIAGAARDFGLLVQTAQQIVSSLQYSIDRLDRTASSLRGFTEEVRSQPSLLLFSEPPRPDARERRSEERQ